MPHPRIQVPVHDKRERFGVHQQWKLWWVRCFSLSPSASVISSLFVQFILAHLHNTLGRARWSAPSHTTRHPQICTLAKPTNRQKMTAIKIARFFCFALFKIRNAKQVQRCFVQKRGTTLVALCARDPASCAVASSDEPSLFVFCRNHKAWSCGMRRRQR